MSGFVERIVARGATLGAVPGAVSLQPRPATRFEAGDFAAGPGAMDSGEVDIAAPGAHRDQPVLIPVRGRGGHDAVARNNSPVSPRLGHETVAQDAPPVAAAPTNSAADNQVPVAPDAARPVDIDPPGTAKPIAAPVSASPVADRGEPVAATSPVAAVAPANDGGADMQEAPPPVAADPPPPAIVDRPQPLAAPPDAPRIAAVFPDAPSPAPAVSVSVGRIEVHFIQPTPRSVAAPAPRPQGFAAYARARRGEPR